MKFFMLLILIVFISHSHNHRVLPFLDPVVDPEPPGVNPVEPIFPLDRPCKKVHVYQENCSDEVLDLREKVVDLQRQLKQLRSEREVTCLIELRTLMNKVHEFETSDHEKVVLDGRESAFNALLEKGYLEETPKFYQNIRYGKDKKASCILLK
jgi:hypothetical protein